MRGPYLQGVGGGEVVKAFVPGEEEASHFESLPSSLPRLRYPPPICLPSSRSPPVPHSLSQKSPELLLGVLGCRLFYCFELTNGGNV